MAIVFAARRQFTKTGSASISVTYQTQKSGNAKIYIIPMIAHPFQRKVWYDGARAWRAFYNPNTDRIEFWYSEDNGVTWTENTNARLEAFNGYDGDGHFVRASDFSISLSGDGNLAIIYTDGSNVYTREVTGTYPGTDWSWSEASTVWSSSSGIKYMHVDIAEDASSYMHAIATKHDMNNGTYYIVHKKYSAKNTVTGGSWSSEDVLSDTSNTNKVTMGSFRKAGTNVQNRGLLVYAVGNELYYRTYDSGGFGSETLLTNVKEGTSMDTFCHECDRPSQHVEKTNHILYIANDGSLRCRHFTWSGGWTEETIIDSNSDCTSPALNSVIDSQAMFVWYLRGEHQNASSLYRYRHTEADSQLVYTSTNGMLSMSAIINGNGVMTLVQENPYNLLWFIEAIALNANARIKITQTKDVTANAGIQITRTKTTTANARIKITNSIDKSALAAIKSTQTITKEALSRIRITESMTKDAIFRIKVTNFIIKEAVSRIKITEYKNVSGLSRIKIIESKTKDATARLKLTYSVIRDAIARIKLTKYKTVSSLARIKISNQDSIKTGNARIQITYNLIKNAISDIKITQSTTSNAIARLRISGEVSKSSIARIKVTQTLNKIGISTVKYRLSLTKSGNGHIIFGRYQVTKEANASIKIVVRFIPENLNHITPKLYNSKAIEPKLKILKTIKPKIISSGEY